MELRTITRSNGSSYTVRKDKSRYFYPDEWAKFYKTLKVVKRPLYDFLINTGCRIDEALHIRPMDFDFDRKNVRLWKTKTKAAKGETVGKPRTIPLASAFSLRMSKQAKKVGHEDCMFPVTQQAAWKMLKTNLKRAGFDDWQLFGLHNIRKTHGMWLKALNVPAEEICLRLGHDYNTYLSHYGSADVFSSQDLRKIEDFFGRDFYQRRRRW